MCNGAEGPTSAAFRWPVFSYAVFLELPAVFSNALQFGVYFINNSGYPQDTSLKHLPLDYNKTLHLKSWKMWEAPLVGLMQLH